MKDGLGKMAQQPLAAACSHHEDHADTGEADDHADDHVGDQDPRRLGPEDHCTGREQQRHQHDEVDEPLGDDRSQRPAHRDVQLLLGEVPAVDVAHLRRHHAIDEERRDHDADQRRGRPLLARVLEEHVPTNRSHHKGQVVHRERCHIEEGVGMTDVVPGRGPVDGRTPQGDADDDDGDADGRDGSGGEEPACQRRGCFADFGLATHQRGGHSADGSTRSERVLHRRQTRDRSEIRPNPAGVASATAAVAWWGPCRLRRWCARVPRALARVDRARHARRARSQDGYPTDGSGRRP